MVAFHGFTHGCATLEYKDRVGYRDFIDATDPFVRNEVAKPFIANFEECQAALDPALPHSGPFVMQWFNDTTGRDFTEAEWNDGNPVAVTWVEKSILIFALLLKFF
ncbi:hypothetical protein EDD15DRAFT_2193015 [Pisolithus albus]|nr:hypothetical protein EDD15DRAFT_2193015 [Pisolithus albus]